jgi:hypothetical protein
VSANLLTLPVDIPWQRICVTEDMIDTTLGDRQFPPRWQSSIALYTYQPPDEDQTQGGSIVSYVKVACTITGYQPPPPRLVNNEPSTADDPGRLRGTDAWWEDPDVSNLYKDMSAAYYGCYGAMLHVVVTPAGTAEQVAKIPVGRYPYFADFEPKRRELYETVSDTGESMSRTLDQIGVNKGLSSTTSDEVLDIYGGSSSSSSGGASFLGIGGSGSSSSSTTGQWGSKSVNQDQTTNVRTSDQQREDRETYSHTTQLTQMYHQLDSYHVGTNRAMFFLLPRPHVRSAPNGFVNGPRLLEGIQEFFLVVIRPKNQDAVCVEAYLETAHIGGVRGPDVWETKVDTVELTLDLRVSAQDVEGSEDSRSARKSQTIVYEPPEGWEIDTTRNPDGRKRIQISGNRERIPTDATDVQRRRFERVEIPHDNSQSRNRVSDYSIHSAFDPEHPDHITFTGWVKASFQDVDGRVNRYFDGLLDATWEVYLRRKRPSYLSLRPFLVPRDIACCEARRFKFDPDSVSWESVRSLTSKLLPGGTTRMEIGDANQMRSEIGKAMRRSINHPDRYPAGAVQLQQTHWFTSAISERLGRDDHPDNVPAPEVPGLPGHLAGRLPASLSRAEALRMPLAELIGRYGLSLVDAKVVQQALLGLSASPPPDRLWDRGRPSLALPTTVTPPGKPASKRGGGSGHGRQ